MAYDEGLAELLRGEFGDLAGVSEKKMFGGLCFLLHGNMVCGVHAGGAMFRVGKAAEGEAMAIKGASPMTFTGRKMGGMIEVDDEALSEDAKRKKWMEMALKYAASLPPK
jgi:TfoX/Sxy family transcriptional regulator of competence genes